MDVVVLTQRRHGVALRGPACQTLGSLPENIGDLSIGHAALSSARFEAVVGKRQSQEVAVTPAESRGSPEESPRNPAVALRNPRGIPAESRSSPEESPRNPRGIPQ